MKPQRRTRKQALFTILNAAATTGKGNNLLVEEFRNIILELATDGGSDANLTVKIQGSISTEVPDFDSAVSKTNHWSYISCVDLKNNGEIDGDVGISVAGADIYKLLELNTNALKWVNVNVTARTEGEVTVKALSFTNE